MLDRTFEGRVFGGKIDDGRKENSLDLLALRGAVAPGDLDPRTYGKACGCDPGPGLHDHWGNLERDGGGSIHRSTVILVWGIARFSWFVLMIDNGRDFFSRPA